MNHGSGGGVRRLENESNMIVGTDMAQVTTRCVYVCVCVCVCVCHLDGGHVQKVAGNLPVDGVVGQHGMEHLEHAAD